MIFRDVTRRLTTPIVRPEEFLLATLSPFVQYVCRSLRAREIESFTSYLSRSLALIDSCPEQQNGTESLLVFCLLGRQANGGLLVLPEEPFLCKALDGPNSNAAYNTCRLCARFLSPCLRLKLSMVCGGAR